MRKTILERSGLRIWQGDTELSCGERVHLGAGHYHWPGFDNLDEETDLKALPYPDESVDQIYAIHLFEHLPRLDVNAYLQEWKRVLKQGNLLILELPSLDKMARLIVAGEKNLRLTLLGIFGDPRDWDESYATSPARKKNPLMRHEWAWTDDEITAVLAENGFEVEIQPPTFHMEQRDMRVQARKL